MNHRPPRLLRRTALFAFVTPMLFAVLSTLGPTAAVLAQNGEGLIMLALDESLTVELTEAPIVDALEAVGSETGLPIELAPGTLEWLPYGPQTRVTLRARNVNVRDALDALLAPMSLTWQVRNGSVVIEPTPRLERINRRPTFTETQILATLARGEFTAERSMIDQLRELTGIDDLRLRWLVDDEPAREQALRSADAALPGAGVAYLDRLCHGRGWTWYLWGEEIVIVTEAEQAQRQIQRRVSVQYENLPLLDVLSDLARKADLPLRMDPGALAAVRDEARENFTLLMTDATVADALQAISGATGLTFSVDGLSVRVGASDTLTAADERPRDRRERPGFLATMRVTDEHGKEFLVIFRPDDLPEELVEQIQQKKSEYVEALNELYGQTDETTGE